MMKSTAWVFVLLAMLVAARPAEAACGKSGKQMLGAVVGGVLGGFLGSRVAGRGNRTAGMLIGGALGAVGGGVLARSLDKCEQEKMGQATEAALNTPLPVPAEAGAATESVEAAQQSWKSETRENVGGTVTAGAPIQTADGKVCRSARRVNYVNGQEITDSPTYCRVPPSSAWAVQAS